MIRRFTERVLILLVAVVVLSLVAGAVLGQPVLFSYVTSDSMAPTLESSDGFVAVPTEVDSSIEVGDVVVFRATEVGGGGLTTHRVVGRTEEGFLTRGDGNTVTDQDSGEPPVKRQRVVAKAWRFDERVVVVPGLGVVPETTKAVLSQTQAYLARIFGFQVLRGPQGLAYLFFAAALGWYLYGEIRGDDRRGDARTTDRDSGLDDRLLIGSAVALLLIAATAAMVVPAGSHEYTFVSADYDAGEPTVVQRGDSATLSYTLQNTGVLPVFLFLEPSSEGVDIEPEETNIPGRSVVNASVTLHAPRETGYYRRYVTEHRYLAVLPRSTIRGLYEVHPWVPVVVIDALIAVPFYLLGVRLAGRARIRRERSRESSQSILTRVRGFVTDLY